MTSDGIQPPFISARDFPEAPAPMTAAPTYNVSCGVVIIRYPRPEPPATVIVRSHRVFASFLR